MKSTDKLEEGKLIVLFDGICNFCNDSVQRIIKNDQKDRFRFASLQSEIGQELTRERGIDTSQVDSIILIDPGNAYYIKSTAALEIAKRMDGLYPMLQLFLILPASVRDWGYDYIAKNRYKWFGKRDECKIPTPDEKAKFIE
ncbi:MAG: thiol-disulfide oxidoreductase DCC family protein [Psychroflexus sp.]|nr:thiol-disulfide oxidoreductase DCC family protein [Psychroflexus sp.]MDR9448291.1 thiol-disulfide oxidoreductase DCC family protein [Psychroflexus sp.]